LNMDGQDAQDKALFTGRCAGSPQNVAILSPKFTLDDEHLFVYTPEQMSGTAVVYLFLLPLPRVGAFAKPINSLVWSGGCYERTRKTII
jgi:hypothetical protein